MTYADQFDLFGYFALGLFVGTVTSHAIKFADNDKSAFKAIAIILPAALGGTAMTFLELWNKADHGMPAYAIGLLLGLMWVRAGIAIENLKGEDKRFRALGWWHLGAVVVASIYCAILFLPMPWLLRSAP